VTPGLVVELRGAEGTVKLEPVYRAAPVVIRTSAT
jgi:hypothetical protein